MEMASIRARMAIDALLHVYALASMYRASGRGEHCTAALGWFNQIERCVSEAKRDLEEHTPDREG